MDKLRIRNESIRIILAELLGTFTLTCIGCAANAYITVNKDGSASAHAIGPWAWGMALSGAIYVCGGVSGGHVNPAVTLGLASVGKLPWRKVPYYFIGQYVGAFLAAVIVFIVYRESINNFGSGTLATAGIFGTFSAPNISAGTSLLDQIVSVSFFLLMICAITDERNMAVPKGLIPLAIGMIDLGVLVFAFGFNCGAPMNPARDFSPRLFTLMAGWGTEVFSYDSYNYFWIPIVGTHIGGILGCWIYKIFIEHHWPIEGYDISNNNESMRNRFSKGASVRVYPSLH